MAETDREAMRDAETEAALAPFLAATRADDRAPPVALLNAILADAAAVSAERQPAPARPGRVWPSLRRWLEPIGGWPSAAALGVCAALGFWVGLSGEVAIDGTTVWAGSTDGTDPVAAFFDLAAAEG